MELVALSIIGVGLLLCSSLTDVDDNELFRMLTGILGMAIVGGIIASMVIKAFN